MSVVHIIHRDNRPWPRPKNHLDGRECPTCGITCHGSKAQAKHHRYHLEEREFRIRLNGWLGELAKRTGLAEEQFGGEWEWGAQITGTEDEIEEAEG